MSEETESRNVAAVDDNRRCSPDGQHSRGDIGTMKLRRVKDLPSSPREYLEPIGEAPGLRGGCRAKSFRPARLMEFWDAPELHRL
jgi:hypothetical protein